MKVLVVEDRPEFLAAAEEAYEQHLVMTTTDLGGALYLLEQYPFDAVITDLFFPESSSHPFGLVAKEVAECLGRLGEDAKPNWLERWKEPHAPLGLRVFGAAVRKHVPCAILTCGNRHDNKIITYLRDRLGHSTGFVFNAILQCYLSAEDKKGFEEWINILEYLLRQPGDDYWNSVQCILQPEKHEDVRDAVFGK